MGRQERKLRGVRRFSEGNESFRDAFTGVAVRRMQLSTHARRAPSSAFSAV